MAPDKPAIFVDSQHLVCRHYVGAYLFGYLADRFGRRKLFLLTLLLYGFFTFLTAFASGYFSFMALRLLAAIGVGAEYATTDAAISEFIPARHRGKTNATVMNFWSAGAILAALLTLYLLNNLPHDIAWRAAFGFGALIALCTGLVRRYIPESPRWLLSQGNTAAAEKIVANIESGNFGKTAAANRRNSEIKRQIRANLWRQSSELVTGYPGRLILGCLLDFSEAADLACADCQPQALHCRPAVHPNRPSSSLEDVVSSEHSSPIGRKSCLANRRAARFSDLFTGRCGRFFVSRTRNIMAKK